MQAKDPVCGMTVESLTAPARRVHEGKTYFFCEKECAAAFEKEPGRYLKKEVAA
ncbi:MAG TPA: YHS domain-containing protein, partial [Thermoanaerobaculia bacterium]|nr:YHS domain-containing protein [Thermoanaerobaculia bacterium]